MTEPWVSSQGMGFGMADTATLEIEDRTPHPAAGFSVGVIIPTHNTARHWQALSASLSGQGVPPDQILIIDSTSSDGTRDLAQQSGYRVVCIPKEEFGHGSTRQLACSYLPQVERLVFLTQDAILNDSTAIQVLCSALDDPEVGLAYGRQLPRPVADAIERHARAFNYPDVSQVKTFESRKVFGIKAAFCSNSFAVYRRSALEEVGGFPSTVLFGEDSWVAARMLMAGWKVAYKAEAAVVHSHGLGLWEEFQRYFDIGVHHHREAWLLETFGNAGNEGLRFVRSEQQYLKDSGSKQLIPKALLRTMLKLVAYRLGSMEHRLPVRVNRMLSTSPSFWPDSSSSKS